MRVIVGLLVVIFTLPGFAGITELSLSTSYRNTNIDENNFTTSLSAGASIAYYFWEMSALELSYTKGTSKQTLRETSATESTVTTAEFEMYGIDFVLSFASRKDAFQPFLKVGAARVYKIFKFDPVGDVERTVGEPQEGIAPSAGAGVRIRLTQTFSLKLGLDAWTSPIDDSDSNPDTIDYAGRASISWLF